MSDPLQKENIRHLARLARLRLSDAEAAAAQADLTGIIAMIDAMQAVDTSDVEPMANPLDATQRLRDDVISEAVDRDAFQQNASNADRGYYLVPRVVE